jgi:pimeloyl-ACP methyl ester carboxylesterase
MTASDSAATKQQVIVRKTYQAFFSPARYEEKSPEREVIDQGTTYHLPFEGGQLAVTTWGTEGPAILLMHGWGGSRAQMTGFVAPLLSAGYRLVAYDQPGHGESDGTTTNLLEIAPTMNRIASREGPFHAVIAHSFGTLITSYALVNLNFPPPRRLVYLGAFNELLESLPRFQKIAGIPDEIMDGFRGLLEENFGRGRLDAITNELLTPKIHIPALLFHDAADNVTPVEDSRAIARVWQDARYVETQGLGHRGALQSKAIHEQIVTFLREAGV